MSLTQAALLGLIQGLTEFLPVSSSGHLAIAETFLGLTSTPLLFSILVHVGTLISVIIYFRNELKNAFTKQLQLIIIATVPAVLFGYFIYDSAQSIFSNIFLVSLALLTTSLLLYLSSTVKHKGGDLKKLKPSQALIIGVFQACAIIPGLSRSGSTITAGRLTGLSRSASFTFSFLLSIPAIAGSLLLGLKDISAIDQALVLPSLTGFFTALVTGLLSLNILERIMSQKNLLPFALYTFILGSFLFGLTF